MFYPYLSFGTKFVKIHWVWFFFSKICLSTQGKSGQETLWDPKARRLYIGDVTSVSHEVRNFNLAAPALQMSLDRAPPMSTPSPGRQWAASTQWSRPVYLVSHEKHVGTENAPNRSIFIRFELSFFLNWSEFNQRSIGTSAMLPACLVSKLRTNLCMGPICEICYIVWVQARLSQFIEEKSPKNYKLSEWAQILWGSSPVSQTKVRQVWKL